MQYKLYDEYYDRAKRLGMSMDEVITLASIIQKETGIPVDMMYVSAVFHNRMNEGEVLGSSATINYLIEINGGKSSMLHTDEQLNYSSPYNTYINQGLPPGPICMPGAEAISAALYPEPNCNYFYFCATGEEGKTAFATTLDEHNENVEKYRDNWIAADNATQTEPTEPEPTETSGLIIIPDT